MSVKNKIDKYLKEEDTKSDPMEEKILAFFKENPNPPDEKIHAFAEKEGMDPDKFEEHVYKILGSIIGAGKSRNAKDDYDAKQVEMGIKVEMEHTNSKLIATRIVKDHLVEIPDYYTRLIKMEKGAGIKD